MIHLTSKPLYILMLAACSLYAANAHSENNAPLVATDVNAAVVMDTIANSISATTDNTETATLEIVSHPTNGVLTVLGAGTTVQYTPDSGYIGDDSYSYRLSNNYENSNVATVSLDVIAANAERVTSNFVERSSLNVNGNLSDWGNLNLFDQDPVDVPFGANDRIDLISAGLAHSSETVYIAYENRSNVDLTTSDGVLVWGWQAFLDIDNSTGSGFKLNDAIGADYLAEGKALYKYNGNGSNWSWEKVGDTNPQYQNNIVELSFSRSLLGSLANVKVAFVGNNKAYTGTSVDYYPDNGSLSYYFGASSYVVETEVATEEVDVEPLTETTVIITPTATSTTVTASNKAGGGGSASWLLFMLPALLLLRRRD